MAQIRLRRFCTKVQFRKDPPKQSLQNLLRNAKDVPNPPKRDIGGWRVTQASEDFPETALRAILQEYEIRLRDNLFKFQKSKYQQMPIDEFCKIHYGINPNKKTGAKGRPLIRDSDSCGISKPRLTTVGNAPWWYWTLMFNSSRFKKKMRHQAWKKIRQKLGVSKKIDNSWMVRRRVRKRLPRTPAVLDDLGHICDPRIRIHYKVLEEGDSGDPIYDHTERDAYKNINRQLWWHHENPYEQSI